MTWLRVTGLQLQGRQGAGATAVGGGVFMDFDDARDYS